MLSRSPNAIHFSEINIDKSPWYEDGTSSIITRQYYKLPKKVRHISAAPHKFEYANILFTLSDKKKCESLFQIVAPNELEIKGENLGNTLMLSDPPSFNYAKYLIDKKITKYVCFQDPLHGMEFIHCIGLINKNLIYKTALIRETVHTRTKRQLPHSKFCTRNESKCDCIYPLNQNIWDPQSNTLDIDAIPFKSLEALCNECFDNSDLVWDESIFNDETLAFYDVSEKIDIDRRDFVYLGTNL